MWEPLAAWGHRALLVRRGLLALLPQSLAHKGLPGLLVLLPQFLGLKAPVALLVLKVLPGPLALTGLMV